jgi:hypothetical protein
MGHRSGAVRTSENSVPANFRELLPSRRFVNKGKKKGQGC